MTRFSLTLWCKSLMVLLVGAALGIAPVALAQTSGQGSAPAAQPPDQTQEQGGPAVDNGPMVIPKKKEPTENTPP